LPETADPVITFPQLADQRPGGIPRAIVHEDDFVRQGDVGEHAGQAAMEFRQVAFLVEDRDDQADRVDQWPA
jgi:hypothetical protein